MSTPFGRLTASASQFANKRGLYLGRRSAKVHVALYRWSGGRIGGRLPGWPKARIALVDHVGAKSGVRRTSPLMCHEDGDAVAVVASKAGQPTHPAWFHNLKANPETTVQVGSVVREVRARVAGDEERDRLWPEFVAFYPGYEFFRRHAKGRNDPDRWSSSPAAQALCGVRWLQLLTRGAIRRAKTRCSTGAQGLRSGSRSGAAATARARRPDRGPRSRSAASTRTSIRLRLATCRGAASAARPIRVDAGAGTRVAVGSADPAPFGSIPACGRARTSPFAVTSGAERHVYEVRCLPADFPKWGFPEPAPDRSGSVRGQLPGRATRGRG